MLLLAVCGILATANAQAAPLQKPAKTRYEYYSGMISVDVDPKSGRVLHVKMSRPTGRRELDDAAVTGFLKARFKPGTARHLEIPVHWRIKSDP
ncbi:MAG: hypothetical protein QOH88_3034 [Verrucomicrobiota bacterium]